MGAANNTSFWGQGILEQKLFFEMTLGSVLKAALIIVVGLLIAKALKRYLLNLSRSTKYVWIINEDTASTLHNLILLVSFIYSVRALGLSFSLGGMDVSNVLTAFFVFYFSYLFAKKSKDYMIMQIGRAHV